METKTLELLIRYFDKAVKDIDFAHLPDRKSEEYRLFLLKTANDKLFCNVKIVQKLILGIGKIKSYYKLNDADIINEQTDLQRLKLRFFNDLEGLFHSLVFGDDIDWTAWPWCLDDNSESMDDSPLYKFIIQGEYCNISAAICHYLCNKTKDKVDFYSSVARRCIDRNFYYYVAAKWNAQKTAKIEGQYELIYGCRAFICELLSIENHIHVGRMLGLDLLAQNIYDALFTYVEKEYSHKHILYAREMASWIKYNWDMDNRKPSEEEQKKLLDMMICLTSKHNAKSPDLDFAWIILTMDVLKILEPIRSPWVESDGENWSEE